MDHDLPIIVFSLREKGNITSAVLGNKVGSIISH
jgi:uridylate kinase